MREASKASIRRYLEAGYWSEVFVGVGLDIGPGDDPCDRENPWKIAHLETFDFDRGDANFIRQHFDDESFDFIHSSHSLEHMRRHPWHCVQDWACLLEVGGHLVITVPDYEMYEKKCWPSKSNPDHAWAFYTDTIDGQPWVLRMADIIPKLREAGMKVIHAKRLVAGWNPNDHSDQTFSFEAGVECAWEVLAVKESHIVVKTPISIRRQQALGDTIAASAFYNHMAIRHDVTFQTSPAYIEYHQGIHAVCADAGHVDLDLDNYDQENPDVPAYLLGFHLAKILIPKNVMPKLFISTEEIEVVHGIKDEPYAIIDVSSVPLMSRSVRFDVHEVAEHLVAKGLDVKYLGIYSPRDFIKVIAGASIVVGRDSGPIQLAQALGTPYVTVMSAVLPHTRYIPSDKARMLSSSCPIQEQGCYHRFWYFRDCPVPIDGVAPCGIIPKEIMLRAIDEVLQVCF